jgi:hypothetical protein
MMEAVRTSETSVDNHFTRQYNPEDSSEHHTRRRENLKSQTDLQIKDLFMHFCRFWLYENIAGISCRKFSPPSPQIRIHHTCIYLPFCVRQLTKQRTILCKEGKLEFMSMG